MTGQGQRPAPAEPRLAATVILMRDGPDGLEAFMVVRHRAIDFASGALVFPGGRLEPEDHHVAGDPVLCPALPGVVGEAMALRVAAIRETFEECGVLLARPEGGSSLIGPDRLRAAGNQPDGGAGWFADMLRAQRLVLAPDLLTPFAHWVTPVTLRKRYDTLFLMARAPVDQVGVHDGSESVDSTWIPPAAALAAAQAGRYTLVFATQLNLQKLSRFPDVASALAAAASAPVVTVVPEDMGTNGQGIRRLRIPMEAGYGGEEFAVDLPPAI